MQRKIKFLIVIALISLNIKCQNKKDKADKEMSTNDSVIDILSIDFESDLDKVISLTNFNLGESEYSEYLQAYSSVSMEKFKLGAIQFNSNFKVNGIDIPNDSYISFSFSKKEINQIKAVHIRYNFIEDDILNLFQKEFGKPDLLGQAGSINDFKGSKNYIWKDVNANHSIIVSQNSDGSALSTGNGVSQKVNSVLIYIVGNASINYPNGQTETVLQRLIDRFSY
ncbi:hypothetical protein [Maribacter sp. 2-571]|uniref:hypothetical protein n=1 Tax=Maribacter sp. 2-571 TaxID=3417569 RepID=UPI003D32EE41